MGVVITNKFGTLVGWNKITYNIMGRDVEAIVRIAYDDNVDMANAYGANKMPIGREEKNFLKELRY